MDFNDFEGERIEMEVFDDVAPETPEAPKAPEVKPEFDPFEEIQTDIPKEEPSGGDASFIGADEGVMPEEDFTIPGPQDTYRPQPEPAYQQYQPQPEKKKKKRFNPLFIIIPLVILIVGGIVGFNIYKKWASDVITVNPSGTFSMYVGDTKTLEVKSEKNREYDYTFTANSTVPGMVSDKGEIKASKPGSMKITVDAGRKYVEPVEVTVNISYKPISVKNGQMIKSPKGNCIAKVELTNATKNNAYFYFKNTKSKKKDFAMYLKPGKKKTIKAPLGTYEIYYATGNTWYGPKYLFGESGSQYKNRQKAKLYKTSRAIYGIRFRIFRTTVQKGNQTTQSIGKDQFPK